MSKDQTEIVGLRWGVKQSFRNYVQAVGGTIETDLGARRMADGDFVFDAAPATALHVDADGGLAGRVSFQGEVRFTAHGGMLAVRLADLAVEIGPSGALLTIAGGPDPASPRTTLATLSLAAAEPGSDSEIVIPSSLSPEGSQLLGDNYPPGAALDHVRLIKG